MPPTGTGCLAPRHTRRRRRHFMQPRANAPVRAANVQSSAYLASASPLATRAPVFTILAPSAATGKGVDGDSCRPTIAPLHRSGNQRPCRSFDARFLATANDGAAPPRRDGAAPRGGGGASRSASNTNPAIADARAAAGDDANTNSSSSRMPTMVRATAVPPPPP